MAPVFKCYRCKKLWTTEEAEPEIEIQALFTVRKDPKEEHELDLCPACQSELEEFLKMEE